MNKAELLKKLESIKAGIDKAPANAKPLMQKAIDNIESQIAELDKEGNVKPEAKAKAGRPKGTTKPKAQKEKRGRGRPAKKVVEKAPEVKPVTEVQINKVAKDIREEGEPMIRARKRAKKALTEIKEVAKETKQMESKGTLTKSKILAEIKKLNKVFANLGVDIVVESADDLFRDATRTALPKGRRVSKNGKEYYESRANRSDSLQGTAVYPKLKLAEGGMVEMGDNVYVIGENKSGVVTNVIANGKNFSVLFADGTKNVYDKNELKKVYSDDDYEDDDYEDYDDENGDGSEREYLVVCQDRESGEQQEFEVYAEDEEEAREMALSDCDFKNPKIISLERYAKGGDVNSLKVGSKVGFLRPNTGRYEFAEVLSIDGNNVNLVVRHPKRKEWDNYFVETKERIEKFLHTPSEDWKDGRPLLKVKYAKGGTMTDYTQYMGMVEVKFANPKYNYEATVSGDITEMEARKYFVGQMFDVGVYPRENMQKVIDIVFHPKGTYAKGGGIDNSEVEELKRNINSLKQQIEADYRTKQIDNYTIRNEKELDRLTDKLEFLMYGRDSFAKGGEMTYKMTEEKIYT
jgi:hypothetical protein